MNNRQTILNTLQKYFNKKTIENLEPQLFFYDLGQKATPGQGYNSLVWSKFDQISASGKVTGASPADDGVTNTDIPFNATSIEATPAIYKQHIILATDTLRRNPINWLDGASKQLGKVMARIIDNVVQQEIQTGTNVLYAGAVTAPRSNLAATDVLVLSDFIRAAQFLKIKGALPFGDGSYFSVISPFQAYDIKKLTTLNGWLDIGKYSVEGGPSIQNGEIGKIGNVRVVESSYVQTFASTVTVHPAYIFGADSFGIGELLALQTYMTSGTPTDSDPYGDRIKVAAKIDFAAKILQQNAMVRIETGVTALTTYPTTW